MGRRFGPRIAILSAILTLVIAGVGLVATLILNAFVLDDYDAYGEVPIPGSTSLHLPAGEVTVSFHTMVTGSPTSGFPIPDLKFSITPPAGVPKPQVTESVGGTTTVNSDTHVQVWVVQIAEEGTYDVVTDGNVNGYISPAACVRPRQFLRLADVGVRRAACPWRSGARRRVVLVRPLCQGGETTRAGGDDEPQRTDVE